MEQRKIYTKELKDSVISKILMRGSKTKTEICNEAGVSLSTASKWLHSGDIVSGMKKNNYSKKWTSEQKLISLIETGSLSEPELGVYLRKEGLYSNQLTEWKSEILASMSATKASKLVKDERDIKIKNLEREIMRKDKALAEASALLILKKKADLIWGTKSEDEE